MPVKKTFKKYLNLAGALVCLASPSTAQDRLRIDLGDSTRSMHPSDSAKVIYIEPAFEDYSFMLSDICEAVSIQCLIYPMMGEIDNALAYQTEDDTRVIVYDRNWSSKIGYGGALAVMAHEVGHHYCQHLTARKSVLAHDAEAESDRFMGFTMAKLGAPLSEVVASLEDLGIDSGSDTHPPIERRVTETANGYYADSLDEICMGNDPT